MPLRSIPEGRVSAVSSFVIVSSGFIWRDVSVCSRPAHRPPGERPTAPSTPAQPPQSAPRSVPDTSAVIEILPRNVRQRGMLPFDVQENRTPPAGATEQDNGFRKQFLRPPASAELHH